MPLDGGWRVAAWDAGQRLPKRAGMDSPWRIWCSKPGLGAAVQVLAKRGDAACHLPVGGRNVRVSCPV